MKNINTELPELIQKLEDKLKLEGHSDVSVKSKHNLIEGSVDIFFIRGNQLLDKYTIFNGESDVSFIRTLCL